MRRIVLRQRPVGVSQMWLMIPGPSMAAISTVAFSGRTMYGLTFQPVPRSRAARRAEPSSNGHMPPLPGAPVGFSGLMERVFAFPMRYSADISCIVILSSFMEFANIHPAACRDAAAPAGAPIAGSKLSSSSLRALQVH